jgi:hypothetical protein
MTMDQTERDNKQARLNDLNRMQMPSDAEKAEMTTLKGDLAWKQGGNPAGVGTGFNPNGGLGVGSNPNDPTLNPPVTPKINPNDPNSQSNFTTRNDNLNPTFNADAAANNRPNADAPGTRQDKKDFVVVDKPNKNLNANQNRYYDSVYPYNDIDVEQGVFIPVKDGQNIDQLSAQLHKAIAGTRYQHAEIERDINGDEVYETVTVMSTKSENGKLILNNDGSPQMNPNSIQRPKLMYARNYILRSARKDDDLGDNQKAPSDGVLIIRTI